MPQSLAHVALVVREYDEAIAFYVGSLGFDLVEDAPQPDEDRRWVVVKPRGPGGASILLAKARDDRQRAFVGDQAAGRVFLFLQTDDFWRDLAACEARGVRFVRPPKVVDCGIVAVFDDLYGNRLDLVEFTVGRA